MSYRIAVTSDDGKYVNQHFGQATHFFYFLKLKMMVNMNI